MRLLEPFSSPISLAAAASTLGLPPVTSAWVGDLGDGRNGLPPEVELEIWAPATVALTAAVLYGGRRHVLVYADGVFTSAASTDLVTKTAHALLTGDGPLFLTNVGGALSAPLVAGTGYYFIKTTANAGKLATSLQNALAGTAIDLTTDGTGTTTISDSADTQRVHWSTHTGLLGLAGDGAIALAVDTGYSARIPHSPRVVAYALVGSVDTSNVSASITPVQDR